MVRPFFILCLLCIMVTACKKSDKQDCPSETQECQFKSNAAVDTVRMPAAALTAIAGNGNKLVFIYHHYYIACPNMIDGGSYETLLFEADPGTGHFSISNSEDLTTARCYFSAGNVLYMPDATRPVAGTIEGTKIDGHSWAVKISLTVMNNRSLMASGIFTAH